MNSSAAWIVDWLKRIWLGKATFTKPPTRDKFWEKWDEGYKEQKLFSFYQELGIAAAHVESSGKFKQVNSLLCEMMGYTTAEILSKSVQNVFFLENDEWEQACKLHNRIELEKCCQHKQGNDLWVNLTISPVNDLEKQSTSYLLQVRSTSKYRQVDESFSQGQDLLKGVIEGIPDAVFVKDLVGRYLITNAAGALLYGKPEAEIIGKLEDEFFSTDEAQKTVEIDRQVIHDGKRVTYKLAATSEGVTRVILFTKTPFLSRENKIIGIVVIARDITEQQRASENLENSRAELRALSARLQSVREEERLKIAREIHDELGQVLTGLKLDLVSFIKKASESMNKATWELLKERSQGIVNLINNAILTVRKISTELRPGLLDAVGLTAAIEWQAKEFETRTGIKCKLKLPYEHITLDQHRSIAIFRIFQEILTNVARHSQATEVSIVLERRDIDLVLEAKDNGRGIRANEFSNPKSLGLLGMRERALLLGGDVAIRGIPNKGTAVTLRIPFENK